MISRRRLSRFAMVRPNLGWLLTLGIIIFLVPSVSIARLGQFVQARTYNVGTSPGAMVFADVNGDGKLDLLTTANDSVSVLLGNGDGSFQKKVTYTTGNDTRPHSLAVGDFNHDGKLDVVTADGYEAHNYRHSNVSVLLGNGDGTFQPHRNYATGAGPRAVAVGDFNGDGNLDLLTTNIEHNSFSISILFGNGDGTFQAHADFGQTVEAAAVAVADFNADGKADLVLPTYGGLVLMLGNGDGTFQPPVKYSGFSATSVVVKDLNGDGKLDLATADGNGIMISVLLGIGDGTFRNHMEYRAIFGARALTAGDFNGDGIADLAVVSSLNNNISILLGKGDGTFPTHREYGAGRGPGSIASGDLNGDGKTDLGVTNGYDTTASIFLGNTAATFPARLDYEVRHGSQWIVTTDFNGDAKADLVTLNVPDTGGISSLSVLLGRGDGRFRHADYEISGVASLLAAGDFNGDGYPDLVTILNYSELSLLLGNGDGTFQAPWTFGDLGATAIAVADVNGDGKPDLVTANGYPSSTVTLLLGNGDGTFLAPQEYTVDEFPAAVTVTDLNGDGKPDLITASDYHETVSVLLANGDGTFRPHADFGTQGCISFGSCSVAVGDFNADGKLDLVVSSYYDVDLLFGNGDGTFKPYTYLVTGSYPFVVVGDFDGDGGADIATANSGENDIGLYLSKGNGKFHRDNYAYATGYEPTAMVLADFNGDGKPDLATVNYADRGYNPGSVSVFLNNAGTTVKLQSSNNPSHAGEDVTFTAIVAPSVPGSGIATGKVMFKDGSTRLGKVALSDGQASLTVSGLSVGEHRIRALYQGDDTFTENQSKWLTQEVLP